MKNTLARIMQWLRSFLGRMRNVNKLKLEAPWYSYQKKVKALFSGDPAISVGEVAENEDCKTNYYMDIEVRDHEKYIALDRVMPKKVTFSSVTMAIILYDEENVTPDTEGALALYETIFKGNPNVDSVRLACDLTGTKHGFVLFKPEVVQFLDDDIYDYNGLWSGLMQEIAKEVFEGEVRGIHFCTAKVDEYTSNVAE